MPRQACQALVDPTEAVFPPYFPLFYHVWFWEASATAKILLKAQGGVSGL